MTIRFDDRTRTLRLSVRDLVEQARMVGHLNLEVVQTPVARMALGRMIHEQFQSEREQDNSEYRREFTVRHQWTVNGWTVHLSGRVDGLVEEGEYQVVEEVKSTALDVGTLLATDLSDWVDYAAQIETYLWMLNESGHAKVAGRLVLISVLDGSRHILGVDLGYGRVEQRIRAHVFQLVQLREARIQWLTARRTTTLEAPVEDWRPGQEEILHKTVESLNEERPLLVEAPTGMGKTAPILTAVLRQAFQRDRQVYWSTSKTTQQEVVERTARQWHAGGQRVRAVTIVAKEKACLNEVVCCRADQCPYAQGYYDKLRTKDVLRAAWETPVLDRAALRALGETHQVCPYQLALDLSDSADLVIGDYNYAFDPERSVVFAREPGEWVVVADEAHQLVERARGYGSPELPARLPLQAAALMARVDPHHFEPFIRLAETITDAILDAGNRIEGPQRDGLGQVTLSRMHWRDLADQVDELAIDYARLRSRIELVPPGELDPWLETARRTLRFRRGLENLGEHTVPLVDLNPGRQRLKLLCLDPSESLAERMATFGGFVGCSATLSPLDFYQDLLGLDSEQLKTIRLPSTFPETNRCVLLASRISTTYKDRPAHAPQTAQLIEECIAAQPGGVAVYFPSFAMLGDIMGRCDLGSRQVFMQRPDMGESERREWLTQLGQQDSPKVLAAVLGGIFAEGIDLPSGALTAVIIVGPALPPVGLERDLLRTCYEERYGAGFQYASLIPGMTKVIQAAGRLLRRKEDKGVILLVGRRFQWRDYAAMLPDWWDVKRPPELLEAIEEFWSAE